MVLQIALAVLLLIMLVGAVTSRGVARVANISTAVGLVSLYLTSRSTNSLYVGSFFAFTGIGIALFIVDLIKTRKSGAKHTAV